MQYRLLTQRIVTAAVAALILASASCDAFALCAARFTCSPGSSPYCYFMVTQGASFAKKLRVEAGGARSLYGLQPGAEYCDSNQGWPDLDNCNLKTVRMNCN